ncbi:MAG: hypothetical protein JZU49_02775 [Sulfuricurvum sp.]|nr:hypothetical protein [Sulfuricurvum sp.]
MALHDYIISNDYPINVRSDLNAVLAAIMSQNSSGTVPTTTKAGMFWYDTASSILKQRNAANDGWLDKWDTTKGMLANLASPTFTGEVNLPSTTYIGGFPIARTTAPIFTGNSTFETLTAWSSVSLPASTTIGGVSPTELSYLDGVTSSIQSQLNALSSNKQDVLVSGTNIKTVNGNPLVGSGNVVITQNPSAVFSNSQAFTASGTFTVPVGVTKLMVYSAHAGAGGGGGGLATKKGSTNLGGNGGGGGASVFSYPIIVPVSAGQNITVTIGAGGAGGAQGGTGGAGGVTYFGSYKFEGYANGGAAGANGQTSLSNVNSIGGGGGGGGTYYGIGGGGGAGGSAGGAGGTATKGIFPCYSEATGGVVSTSGGIGGTGGTSNAVNGNNGGAYSGLNGGSGGAGGAGKVIVYW